MGSGNKDLCSLIGGLNLKNIHLDTLCGLEGLTLDLLTLGKKRICFTKVDAHVAADIALDRTGDNLLLLAEILVVDYPALFLTDFL